MDLRQNRRYFESLNWVLLASILIIGIVLLFFYWIAGLIILLGLGTYMFFKIKDYPTDDYIDETLDQQVQEAIERGFVRLHINRHDVREHEPIVFHGPVDKPLIYDPVLKRGKDAHVRSSAHEVSVFYFGKHHLYVYQIHFSLVDEHFQEKIHEFRYEDIVSMTVDTATKRYYEGRYQRREQFEHHVFKMIVGGAYELNCPLLDNRMVENEVFSLLKYWRGIEGERAETLEVTGNV